MWPAIIISGIVVIVIIAVIAINNKLVKYRLRVDNQWSQINVLLKKRYDMIPNLVETVKGYAKHEKETLEDVVKARNIAVNSQSSGESIKNSKEFEGALSRLLVIAERYPSLKADSNFLELQNELRDMETQIAKYRQFYNDTVMKYNQTRAVFPNNIIAGILGFKDREFFTVENEEKTVPKVSF